MTETSYSVWLVLIKARTWQRLVQHWSTLHWESIQLIAIEVLAVAELSQQSFFNALHLIETSSSQSFRWRVEHNKANKLRAPTMKRWSDRVWQGRLGSGCVGSSQTFSSGNGQVLLTLIPGGEYFTPSTGFVIVRKFAYKIERRFVETLWQILWSFENRWVHVNIYFRFIRTWPEVRTKRRKSDNFMSK